MTYEYTDDMDEISGFGGGYEAACRRMVVAGLTFWDEQGEGFDPCFHGYRNLYGVIEEDNDDARGLTAALLEAVPDASGAMHQATVGHILAIKAHSWEWYVGEMQAKAKGTDDA